MTFDTFSTLPNPRKSRFYCRNTAKFKVLQGPNPTDVSMISMSTNTIVFVTVRMFFHKFSSFFKHRSQKPLLEVPSADLSSKTNFGEPFWAPGRRQNTPLELHFPPKRHSRFVYPEVFISSLSQPGRDSVPKAVQRRFGIDFNSFWVDLGCILAAFFHDCT